MRPPAVPPGEVADGDVTVLHVDDEPGFADVTAEFLERAGGFDVLTEECGEDALARIAADSVDCVVSDHDMPSMNGLELLARVRESHPDLPFILFTGKGSEEVAGEAISAGVTDYLQKGSGTDQYTVLANRIRNAVEQDRSRRALEASQKRLSLFIDQSPLGVIEYDDSFEIVRVNGAAEDILGYDEADLVGGTWMPIVPADQQRHVAEIERQLLENNGGYHTVNENVTASGERIYCEWYNRVVTDDDGEVVAIFSQFRDVTDRRERERELARTNAVLRALANHLDVGVLVENERREVVAANTALVDLLGLEGTPAELEGRDCADAAEELKDLFADPEAFVDGVDARIAGEETVATDDLRMADGRLLERTYVAYDLPEGEANLWLYRQGAD